MENEQYIESGLSVGAMKIANKYEIFTEEEIDAINNKIPELDERVGVIEDEIEDINSSLDNKANNSDLAKIDLSVSNKVDKTYVDNKKITMTDLSQDVKEAMTGGSVAVIGSDMVDTINVKNNAITTDKISMGAITINKITVDILPKDENMWSTVPYTFSIGQVSNKGSYGSSESIASLSYRHDSSLIEVEPNAYITVINNPTTNYKIAIQEFDIEKKGVADRGYQTNSINKIQLSANTRYIRLVCSTKDGSKVTISAMNDLGISVEATFSNVYNKNKYSDNFKNNERLIKRISDENIISLRDDYWEQKDFVVASLKVGASTVDDIYNTGTTLAENRYRLKKEVMIETNGFKKFYIKANAGYSVDVIFIDSYDKFNGIAYFNGVSATVNSSFIVPDDTKRLTFKLYNTSLTSVNISDLENINLHLSLQPISEYKQSYDDINYHLNRVYNDVGLIKSTNPIKNIIKGNCIKYIGHSGTSAYAPENTLEGYRIAKVMGMWGAECDLCITSDKKLVLMHDFTVDRTTNGVGSVSDMTLSQIQELKIDLGLKAFTNVKIPTIEQYLDECKKLDLVPVIEVKNNGIETGMVNELISTLNKYNIWDNIVIISFGKEVLQAIREVNKIVTLAFLTQSNQPITNADIDFVKSLGNACINCHGTNIITRDMIDSCHAENIPVMVWTINDESLEEYFISIGVDAITTDTQFSPSRATKTYKFQVYTTDKGITWNIRSGKTLIEPKLSRSDDWVLDIDCGEHLKSLLQQIECTIKAENNSYYNNGVINIYAFKQSNGLIKLQLVKNGALIQTNSLTDNNLTINCEITV